MAALARDMNDLLTSIKILAVCKTLHDKHFEQNAFDETSRLSFF